MQKSYTENLINLLLDMVVPFDNLFLSLRSFDHTNLDEFVEFDGIKQIILKNIYRNKKLTMSQIANLIGSSRQRITSPINSLVHNGYVIRTQNENDKRCQWISLTDKGYNIISDYITRCLENLCQILDQKFSLSKQESLLQSLEEVNSIMLKLNNN